MQRLFQLALLLVPACIFGLRSCLDLGALVLDGIYVPRMLPLSSIKRGLRLRNGLLTALATFFPGGLFLPACGVLFPLFSLVSKCRLASSFLVNLTR